MVEYVGLDVIIITCLEFNKGESGCLAEDTAVVCDCPERDSGISCKSSRPGIDGSGTPLGIEEEARDVVNVDDFTGRKVWGVGIDE